VSPEKPNVDCGEGPSTPNLLLFFTSIDSLSDFINPFHQSISQSIKMLVAMLWRLPLLLAAYVGVVVGDGQQALGSHNTDLDHIREKYCQLHRN